jgi:phosphatidylglycerol---prolipoprotein diacylglyceryl transferase
MDDAGTKKHSHGPATKQRRRRVRTAKVLQPVLPTPQARSASAVGRNVVRATPTGAGAGTADSAEPQGLTATFCFDAGLAPRPYAAEVHLIGRRVGAIAQPRTGDRFTHEERISSVVLGSGLVSITARIFGINAGEWSVAAELVRPPLTRCSEQWRGAVAKSANPRLQPVAWSWRRWALIPRRAGPLNTRWARLTPLDSQPAVVPGSWIGLVTLGVVLGFVVQALMLGRQHVAFGTVLPVSLLAVLSGVVGAKAWYIALNPHTWRAAPQEGWCIQGGLVGATAVGAIAVALLHLPIGVILDATTPGLFFGMAVGRLGCFFTGCCAGRPTASRFGVWCSDRRVGARRVPTQLMESLAALVIALAGLFLLLHYRFSLSGLIFVASVAAYTLCRQVILRPRAESRRSAIGGPLTAGLAALVLAASVLWLLASSRGVA